ncbi:hypothetical protein VFPPC_04923 [Pochonia chlamydosporia 170]|uniref:Uncharacterized protein n=1 Tax=Pochonia chlamydosporia 170 TaxID=1380566 RepID=A0A179FSY3_METCM|nr:hypothetical protein VFPPC_04923 [Pochonia chlamydosporia 170]OAQ68722.1 hypothetical protein VFPPC_04923 [Pochonia chlamydosporia 170]
MKSGGLMKQHVGIEMPVWQASTTRRHFAGRVRLTKDPMVWIETAGYTLPLWSNYEIAKPAHRE